MRGRFLLVLMLGGLALGCGNHGGSHMVGPSPISTMPVAGRAGAGPFMMGGHWAGTFGHVSGDAMVEWMLSQDGTHVMGPTTWTDTHGHHDDWVFSGQMTSDSDLSFTWQSPGGHMIGSMMLSCPVTIQGTGHLGWDANGMESITGTYSATGPCLNTAQDGQFMLQRD